MSSATKNSVLEQLQQIDELRRQAESHYKLYEGVLQTINTKVLNLVESKAVVGVSRAAAPKAKPKASATSTPGTGKKRGRPRKTESAPATTPDTGTGVKRGRGRPRKTEAAPVPASAVKVVSSTRNYDNPKSLRETCWEILDRDPSSYRKILKDYPEGATGLKVIELKEIIEKEGKWTSSSSDIGAQVQNCLHGLRNKEGKLHRNEEDRRYYIIDGKELDA
jgi:hypothetical protein